MSGSNNFSNLGCLGCYNCDEECSAAVVVDIVVVAIEELRRPEWPHHSLVIVDVVVDIVVDIVDIMVTTCKR